MTHARRPKPATPDHFYTADGIVPAPPGARPDEDPLAARGTPVFKPSLADFGDFERYMNAVEPWGMRAGIVKIIPPEEWSQALPSVVPQLADVRVKNPIEQDIVGTAGLFRVQNIEKRRLMSVREWHELCNRDELRTPGVLDGADRRDRVHVAAATRQPRARRGAKNAPAAATAAAPTPTPAPDADEDSMDVDPALLTAAADDGKPGRRSHKERMEARAERDAAFLAEFDPHVAWLPPATTADDYTPDFCRTLERMFWRSLGLGRPAWYGADSSGSLFTDATTCWNVANLPSLLNRLLPGKTKMPGVNTPYLYFGMWRATFAWHVEDMDLFSINYVHFGAPKHWYAIPQQRATAFEQIMQSNFPSDISQCPQFLRHKAFLMSPSKLANTSCKPNVLVQHAGEFVITYPRGYHAGFNLGFNCAESVNFALDSWLDLGRKAAYCNCISDSVRIDVDELLLQRAEELELEKAQAVPAATPTPTRTSKRKSEHADDSPGGYKKIRFTPVNKLPHVLTEQPAYVPPSPAKSKPKKPAPAAAGALKEESAPDMPCCLCASGGTGDLLPVHDPPLPGYAHGTLPGVAQDEEGGGGRICWRAHESCARVVPETWIDNGADGKRYVFGVDAVVKDRWNLKCQLCTTPRARAHGAPIQCTKGKCPKAFHVACLAHAPEAAGIAYRMLGTVEKEVVADDGRVISSITKASVEVFCAQHNPAAKAARKKGREERQRSQLLALPVGSRIRVRVSSGVYEVSLVRVDEEEQSVEVLWDDDRVKRTFKWGSIMWHGENLVKPEESSAPSTSTKPKLIMPSPSAIANVGAAPSSSTVAAVADKPIAGPSKPAAAKSKAPIPYPFYAPPPPGYYYAPYPYPYPPPAGADGKPPAYPFPYPPPPPPPSADGKPPPAHAFAYPPLPPDGKPPASMPYPPPPPPRGGSPYAPPPMPGNSKGVAYPPYPPVPPGAKPPPHAAYPYPPPPPPPNANGKAPPPPPPYGYSPYGYYPPPPGNLRHYPTAVYQTPGAPLVPPAGKAKAAVDGVVGTAALAVDSPALTPATSAHPAANTVDPAATTVNPAAVTGSGIPGLTTAYPQTV